MMSHYAASLSLFFADVRKYVAELIKIGHEVDPCESNYVRIPAYLVTETETTLASDFPGQSRTELAYMETYCSARLST